MKFKLPDNTKIQIKLEPSIGLKVPYKTYYKINNGKWICFGTGVLTRFLQEIISKSTSIKEFNKNIKDDKRHTI